MVQPQLQSPPYTPDEYLALEDAAEHKSEYVNGQIFALAGGTLQHDKIAGNIHTCLNIQLRDSSCDVYSSDVKVLIRPDGAFVYPDVLVLCGQPNFYKQRRDIISNPILIVEVLSESTRHYDLTAKFELYQQLTTLQDYLLVDQSRIHVQHYHKLADNRWVLTIFTYLDSEIQLESLGLILPISKIYRKINWTAS